jgi:hypothetical protein
MKYEKVTIEGKEYYKVPIDHFYDTCDGCHFWQHSTCQSIRNCVEDDTDYFKFMTESELAAHSILKKEEKQRNID